MSFEHNVDKQRALDGRPWLFDNHYFGIEEFDGFTMPRHMDFTVAFLWLNLFNLPLNGITRSCGVKIGGTIGLVEDIDVHENGVGWGKSLRVKVRMDLTKLIARGRKVTIRGVLHWVSIKYEKLPRVCFQCGCVIHLKH